MQHTGLLIAFVKILATLEENKLTLLPEEEYAKLFNYEPPFKYGEFLLTPVNTFISRLTLEQQEIFITHITNSN